LRLIKAVLGRDLSHEVGLALGAADTASTVSQAALGRRLEVSLSLAERMRLLFLIHRDEGWSLSGRNGGRLNLTLRLFGGRVEPIPCAQAAQ
jgi:hypothetical protein